MDKIIVYSVCFCLSLFCIFTSAAQEANYDQAKEFATERLEDRVGSQSIDPNWIEGRDRFWYDYETNDSKRWLYVNPIEESKELLFDHEEMASQLSDEFDKPFNRLDLPLKNFKYNNDDEIFTFHVDSIGFSYDRSQNNLVRGDSADEAGYEEWANYSPDSTWIAFAREHNLYLMKVGDPDSTEYQLTEDGERWYSYQEDRGDTTSTERLPTNAEWFEDSEKLYVKREDWREVDELWVINSLAKPRPELETYKYSMPGEEKVHRDELQVFDVEDRERVEIEVEERWEDQMIGGTYFNEEGIFPGQESQKIHFLVRNRTWDQIDVYRANTETGESEIIFSETNKPYFNTRFLDLEIINGGEEYIWWSERDGWGQLYLYDNEGNLKNRITDGNYNVGEIAHIDTTGRTVYFEGFGREDDVNPYYSNYYSVNFDGTELRRVTEENASHSFSMSDSGTYFVNTYSRVDKAPVSVVRDSEGNNVMELEQTDISRLNEIGWTMPEPFTVKAKDDKTDLHGVMWKPADFDPEKEYPIITYVYPGPQVEPFPKEFSVEGRGNPAGLAQLGFIVVAMGQRGGSPLRHKYYHTYGYGNLRDYPLKDNKYGIEQLAARHDFIDSDRVGIYGHSGGGFMSTAALLTYPNFYDVAVSSSGNHDNNIYNLWWSEVHHGVEKKSRTVIEENEEGEEEETEETFFESEIPANTELADNLQGRLLLVTGDMDDNVHPANTYRMADALIEAGKRFDFMIIPGQRHGFGEDQPYFERLLWDYFAEHLLDYRHNNIDLDLPEVEESEDEES